ncbi:hydroxypyruvate isomerase family protein [Pseudomonas sp. 5P_3.1_Bac2]|uniref:hydroxypyruvate isomerase family protein n=1 Tax=Pseudomonas sp. 5P_3.1_Bac2 TaxID=2971617 RepID=UPI0021C6AD3D|nr:TIM barrel protein [Pseudomonas sp. 5P_3.1_Bac2]MCU1716449.1 TIM barrel protein [Pseudomonas sp. 5P_3.1_Bac2]
MKIAANLSLLFNELSLAQRIVAAAAAGFDGVEIQFPYEELAALKLKDLLERSGLPLRLLNVPAADLLAGGPGLACVPERQAQFDQALEQALSYAAMTRPALINVLPGRLPEGVSFAQAWDCLVGNLRKAAEAFAVLNIGVVVEAINPLDMPGFLINTPQHLSDLLDAVDHANLRAQYDLYHMARQELDVLAGLQLLRGRIGHVQFADYPGRGAPGSGRVDFAALLAALKHSGYDGWLAAEYRPDADGTQASLAWLAPWRAQLA